MSDTLTLRNLTIGYKQKHGSPAVVLSDINASLTGGRLTALLGPNGAGKSTLLRTLAGFQPPLSGSIVLAGRRLETFSPARLARTVGIVLTERPDVVNMTAREMVLMGRSPYTGFWGRYSAADGRIADEAIALVGISRLASRRVSTLSDGERQKVMIAKALAQQTPLILLDEPTAFLDFPSKVEIMKLLSRICHTSERTVLLSTHDVDLALQLSDEVWLMGRNRPLVTGTPRQLASDGSLPLFFQSPDIAFDASSGLFRVLHDQ